MASTRKIGVFMKGSVLEFPSAVNTPSPDPPPNTPVSAGRPAAHIVETRPDLVLRHVRRTRNVVTVARRMGVRANDVFLVVLNRMELLERKAA